MKALPIRLFTIHSLGDVRYYSPLPLGSSALIGILSVGNQTLILFCHDPTLRLILSGSGLQWHTHNPSTCLNFVFLLGLRIKEKVSTMCCKSPPYMTFHHSLPGRCEILNYYIQKIILKKTLHIKVNFKIYLKI